LQVRKAEMDTCVDAGVKRWRCRTHATVILASQGVHDKTVSL
jgi:hypothetical protein